MTMLLLFLPCITGFLVGFIYIIVNRANEQMKTISQHFHAGNMPNNNKKTEKGNKNKSVNVKKNFVCDDTGNESDWEDISSSSDNNSSSDADDSSEEYSDDDEDEDDNYDYYVERNLKMILIVCQDNKPKLSAQEVAEYAATAAIGVVQKIVSVEMPSNGRISEWFTWYKWWNRVGCAKITLRCPDKTILEHIITTTAKTELPFHIVKREHQAATVNENNKGSNERDTKETVENKNADGEVDVVVVAIGPAPSDVLNPITGKLKLLS